MSNNIDAVIFDLGGVLIDWDPSYLYRKIFDTESEIEHFLTHICDSDWNEQQDAGRPLREGTEILVGQYPEHEVAIRAFYGRWAEMLGGVMEGSLEVLHQIHRQNKHRLYALTNWSQETFPIALERYDFLQLFEGILVSGEEKLKKPDPRFYRLLRERYQLVLERSIFIDDNLRNVKAARKLGIDAIHFQSSEQLKKTLTQKNII